MFLTKCEKNELASKQKIDPQVATDKPIPSGPEKRVLSGFLAYAYFGCPVQVPPEEQLGLYAVDGKDLDKRTKTARKYI